MKRVHQLRVEVDPEHFQPLFDTAAAAGLRMGWLELPSTLDDPTPLPPALEQAAGSGALRAVSAEPGRTVTVKPRRGPAVLEDLLREHFRGCVLVLIRGEAPVPSLRLDENRGAGHWVVSSLDGTALALTTEELVARLRKPRPWS
ncbi:MAG: hypothetical protein SX243_18845 [Acidobacteriota bacterium]|nr:hypothetical protein [Acidobacteriota bacterium]